MSGAPRRSGRREEAGVPPALRGSVSRVLRVGLGVASAFLVVGLLLYLREGTGLGPKASAVGWTGPVVAGLVGGAPGAFVLVGLLVLLMTPIARVAVSVVLFASVGDRALTGLTLFVLLLLAATLAVGGLR